MLPTHTQIQRLEKNKKTKALFAFPLYACYQWGKNQQCSEYSHRLTLLNRYRVISFCQKITIFNQNLFEDNAVLAIEQYFGSYDQGVP